VENGTPSALAICRQLWPSARSSRAWSRLNTGAASSPKPGLANAYHGDKLRDACPLAYAVRTIRAVPDGPVRRRRMLTARWELRHPSLSIVSTKPHHIFP
jgi:hypothetical protein